MKVVVRSPLVVLVIYVSLWWIVVIKSRLNHVYASLVGCLGWHSYLWCRRFKVWEGLIF